MTEVIRERNGAIDVAVECLARCKYNNWIHFKCINVGAEISRDSHPLMRSDMSVITTDFLCCQYG